MSTKIDEMCTTLREAVRGEDVREAMIECFKGIEDDADAAETSKNQAGAYASNASKNAAAAANSASAAQTANSNANLAQTAAERAKSETESLRSDAEALKNEAKTYRDEAAASAGSKTYSLYVDSDGDICVSYTPAGRMN
jgi:outer membrane biosynthesis protein TonB